MAFGGCSSVEHHTDPQAAMARMTYSPEKCETIGPTLHQCNDAHSLPRAQMTDPSTNDVEMVR